MFEVMFQNGKQRYFVLCPAVKNSLVLRIFIKENYIDCTRNDFGIGKSIRGYQGVIYCPNLDVYCNDNKPFYCKFGNYNNDLQKCVCYVGYTGQYESIFLALKVWVEAEIFTKVEIITYTGYCVKPCHFKVTLINDVIFLAIF